MPARRHGSRPRDVVAGNDGLPVGRELTEGFHGRWKVPGGDVVPVDHAAHPGEAGLVMIVVEVVKAQFRQLSHMGQTGFPGPRGSCQQDDRTRHG